MNLTDQDKAYLRYVGEQLKEQSGGESVSIDWFPGAKSWRVAIIKTYKERGMDSLIGKAVTRKVNRRHRGEGSYLDDALDEALSAVTAADAVAKEKKK